MIRDIITYPDSRLRLASKTISEIDNDIRLLVTDMIETCRAAEGAGLAAIQIGSALRVIVVDLGRSRLTPMINPVISSSSGTSSNEIEEGCLSIPGKRKTVTRWKEITVEYLDLDNKKHKVNLFGAHAVIVQHELDHLEGNLIIDYRN